jgi:predicted site-specific integrase-resolvase
MRTSDAARLVEVSEATIRQWKRRGHLPDVYTAQDVWRCASERMPAKRHAELDAIWVKVERGTA